MKEVVFKLKHGLEKSREPLLAALVANASGMQRPERVFRHAGKHEARHVAAGLDRWYVASSKVLADEALAALNRHSVVSMSSLRPLARLIEASEEPRHGHEPKASQMDGRQLSQFDGAPNDPRYSDQTHYSAVGMERAWAISSGSSDVVVAIVDSGIDMTHEDLRRNQWVNFGEICGNGVDDDGNGYIDDCRGYNFGDDHGHDLEGDGSHGTHCAGIVAADTYNGIGVAGTAGGSSVNPGASLMILTTFGKYSNGGFAEAIVYGADNGAAISSNSWGYVTQGSYDASVLDAIDYFNEHGGGNVSEGGIVVFAAGNDNDDGAWYPGYYGNHGHEGSVAVASTTDRLDRSSFSNYGSWVDVAAPGSSILSTVLNGGYRTMSGTSMACPMVSGILALFMSYTPHQPRSLYLDCLYSTATATGWTGSTINGGVVNPAEALESCLIKPPSTPPVPPAPPAPPPSPSRPPLPPGAPPPPSTPPMPPAVRFTTSILTDNYPGETTWVLHDASMSTIAEGGPFRDRLTLYETNVDLQGGAYTFQVLDTASDGLCCGYGQGAWSVSLHGSVVHTGNPVFSSSAAFAFQLPLAPSPPMYPPAPPLPPAVPPQPAVPFSSCQEECNFSSDGDCDDGGLGSEYSICDTGNDCTDCGPRNSRSSPPVSTPPQSPSLRPPPVVPPMPVVLSPPSPPALPRATINVTVLTDDYPHESSWSLVSSSGATVATGGPFVLAKHEYYSLLTLPQDVYVFTIYDSFGDGICCAYGPGRFEVTTIDNGVIATGGQFGSRAQHTFALPFDPESMPPIPSPWPVLPPLLPMSPMLSPLPPPPCRPPLSPGAVITVDVMTDQFPMETTWILEYESGAIASGGPYHSRSHVYTNAIPLTLQGNYTFIIYDTHGDGICCAHGHGFYQLRAFGGQLLVFSGGSFGSGAQHTFHYPFPVLPPLPPRAPPSPSLPPAPPHAPPMPLLQLLIQTDNYPNEVTWTVVEGSTSLTILYAGGPYPTRSTAFVHNLTLGVGAYHFRILDSANDGLCCAYGEGLWRLTYGGTIVLGQGATYGGSDSLDFSLPLAPAAPPAPAAPFNPCHEDCNFSSDGDCDDGGVGSEYAICAEGSDCYDCGARTPSPRPPLPASPSAPSPPSPAPSLSSPDPVPPPLSSPHLSSPSLPLPLPSTPPPPPHPLPPAPSPRPAISPGTPCPPPLPAPSSPPPPVSPPSTFPPPSLPPIPPLAPPPWPPGWRRQAVATFTAEFDAPSPETFDSGARQAYSEYLSNVLDVPIEDISLEVRAASVLVIATIRTQSEAAAAAAVDSLATITADNVTAALVTTTAANLTVVSDSLSTAVESIIIPAPSPPPSNPPRTPVPSMPAVIGLIGEAQDDDIMQLIGLGIAAAVGSFAIVAVCCTLYMRRKSIFPKAFVGRRTATKLSEVPMQVYTHSTTSRLTSSAIEQKSTTVYM